MIPLPNPCSPSPPDPQPPPPLTATPGVSVACSSVAPRCPLLPSLHAPPPPPSPPPPAFLAFHLIVCVCLDATLFSIQRCQMQVRWMKLTGCATNWRDWRLPFRPWLVQQGQWALKGLAVGLDPSPQHSLANNPRSTNMKSEIPNSNACQQLSRLARSFWSPPADISLYLQ